MTSHVTKLAELVASFVFSSISSSPSTVTCLSGFIGVGRHCLLTLLADVFRAIFLKF